METVMTSTSKDYENEVTEEELEIMDDALTQIEMLYKSRCVSMPGNGNNNVTIREIPSKKDEK